MKKNSVVLSMESAINQIVNREITPAHVNYLGYAVGLSMDLSVIARTGDGVNFFPNELKLIDNLCMRLIGPTTLEVEDIERVKEVAAQIAGWRRCVAEGNLLQASVYSDATAVDRLTRLSHFVAPEVIASVDELKIQDESFFNAVSTIIEGEYEAIKNGNTASGMILESEEAPDLGE